MGGEAVPAPAVAVPAPDAPEAAGVDPAWLEEGADETAP